MSDPTENTKELDSYGVWVKNDKTDSNDVSANDLDSLQELSDIDIPDFEFDDDIKTEGDFAEDFSDMFKDTPSDDLDNIPDTDDTALTIDELDNITNNPDDISIEAVDSEPDVSDFGSFEAPSTEDNSDFEVSSTEEVDISSFEEISFDDITSDSSSSDSVEEEGEIELSLDDFMDGGFSDESVASGNNGFEPGKNPAEMNNASEEISLDDFLDGEDFGLSSAPKQEENTFIDEKPLDMEISFDSSAETIATEENNSALYYDDSYDDDEETETVEETSTEVDISSFSDSSSNSDIDAEEVSLADFGIDADAEETPVTQDVAEQKNKEVVVDYNLTVGDENMATAPVVNEIKDKQDEGLEELSDDVSEWHEETSAGFVSTPTETVSSGLLQQIVADLASLKEEISTLKANLSEMKNTPAEQVAVAEEPVVEDFVTEEPVVETAVIEENPVEESIDIPAEDEMPEIEIPEETKDEGGFFGSSNDEDDTIALSGFELDNIMNNAVFETSDAPETDDTVMESEPVIFESTDTVEEDLPETIEIENSEIDNTDAVSDGSLSYDFSDENLEEPNLDAISVDEEFTQDDLPEEISISTEDQIDDMFVESSETDFMNSVSETTEEQPVDNTAVIAGAAIAGAAAITAGVVAATLSDNDEIEEISDETIEDDFAFDVIEETTETEEAVEVIEEPVLEENPIEASNDDFAFDVVEEATEEPVVETIEEPVLEEKSAETSDDFTFDVIEETTETEEPVEDDFVFDIADSTEVTEETVNDEITEEIAIDENVEMIPETDDSITEETVEDELDDFSFDAIEDEPSLEMSSEDAQDDIEITETEIEEAKAAETVTFDDIFEDDASAETDSSDGFETMFESVDETESEPDLDMAEEEFNTVDALDETTISSEEDTIIEETPAETICEEPVVTEEPVEESIPVEVSDPVDSTFGEETAISESELTDDTTDDFTPDFVSIENNNTISDSNLDFLNQDKNLGMMDDTAAEDSDNGINKELKQDIKSVLLYMDQLLANLPEDKIDEFAKSEEFNTYKKLFSELGLS